MEKKVTERCEGCGREIEGKPTSTNVTGPVDSSGDLPKQPAAQWGFECQICQREWVRDPIG